VSAEALAAPGPRAVEGGLLEELDLACARAVRDLVQLGRPLRVVVPSRAVRESLCCALIERAECARLGLRIQTLESIALEVLERAGERVVPALLYPLAVRERARREVALARDLDRLDDGYAAVVASVDDLLDAGFTASHVEALEERVAEAVDGPLRARAIALLRVAADVSRELAAAALGHRSAELARANECLRAAGPELLPTRALWIHGFADATGVQLDLLETLAQRFESRIWLDRPEASHTATFGARLRERLAPSGLELGAAKVPDARVAASRHADPEAEARAAAVWAREWIAAGAVPERIAIVARDLSRHRLALRRQLGRLGVPFSGVAECGAALPTARRLGALWELLERGGALPAERWLEVAGASPGSSVSHADLRDALHVQGIASLADLAAAPLSAWPSEVSLPARTGLALGAHGVPVAPSRRVAVARLAALRATARATLRHLDAEPARALLATRVARLGELQRVLGWSADTPGRAELEAAFAEPERAGDRPIRRDDLPRLLRRELADAGTDLLGGRGGGVAVLTVMEARSRSFDALRVIGLNRGVFPRRVGEDPLLPDALRRALRDVLPDLPIKGEGHEEERFLFAQLLVAAPHVHLSCARRDASGRPTPVSPLFERSGGASPELEDSESALRSPRDALLHTALAGGREAFAAALPEALADGRRALGLRAVAPGPVARARLAVLRELDPRDARRHELGPFLGGVGPPCSVADPRRGAPAVTLLEGTARCPWQAFLSKILRVAPPPDAWGALPSARDARRVGNVVHKALELLCSERADGGWPAEVSETLLLEAALGEARREGVALPGFAHALARCAAPYVEVARRLDALDEATPRSVESYHVVQVRDAAGQQRELRFRVDRVDEAGGVTRFTDWKTGKGGVPKAKAADRREDHRKRLARGELLQGHAYALTGARGRYVYLHPDLDDAARVLEAEPAGPQREAFDASVATLLGAQDAGAFPPRVRLPDRDEETSACRSCELKQACLRGDSGARLRLGAWAEAGRGGSPLERAALALWRLPGAGA